MVLTTVLAMLTYVGQVDDRDFIDRLHSYFSTNLLIALSMLVSFKQFGGKPMECMVPDIFTSSWEQLMRFDLFLRLGRMSLDAILKYGQYFGSRQEGDGTDELHSAFTSNALIVLAVLVSFKQFGGRPVECMVPDWFSSSWEQYAENYCWAQNTYFVPFGKAVEGVPVSDRREQRISYYQWVPFFLLIQAACFRMPSLVWKYMAGYSGIKIHEIVKLASDTNNIKPDIKQSNIKALTVHLQGALRFHRRLQKKQIKPHKIMRIFNLPYSAFFVTAMYLLTKLLYLINVCVQLFFMNKFLISNHKYSWYGFGAMADLLNGSSWEETELFPRVSLCDFDVRVHGGEQRHTIQCVLVINIFNEKIFIFLWFWFVSLLAFTTLSFLYWMSVTMLSTPNERFISRHMEMSEMPFDPDVSKGDVNRFLSAYLKSDGAFVIRMITMHSGVIFATDLVLSLWKSFYGIEEEFRRSTSIEAGGHSVSWPPPPTGTSVEGSDNKHNILRLRKRPKSVDSLNNELTKKLIPPEVPVKPSAPKTLDEPDSVGGKPKSSRFSEGRQKEVDDNY